MPHGEQKDQNQPEIEEQTLDLSKETLKDLDADVDAEKVKGGLARTSFSCGQNLCISINAC